MFDASFFAPQIGAGQPGAPDPDAGLIVVFDREPRQNEAKSEIAGRPIADEVEVVTILLPGARDVVGPRPVTDDDRRRFGARYAEFKRRDVTPVEGTPLDQWPALSRVQLFELRALQIRTVDQVANLSEDEQRRAGLVGTEFVARARAFLEHARDGASTERLAAENSRLRGDLTTAHAEIQRLLALIAAPKE